MRREVVFAALAVGLLLLTLVPLLRAGPVAPPSLARPGAPPAAPLPRGNTSINDIIQLNLTSPVGQFAPGSVLLVSYRVALQTTTPTPSATVYVPGLVASFPAVPAPIIMFLPGHNLTLASGSTAAASPTGFTLRNTTSFNGTHPSNLNSELVALMSSEPFGDAFVVVEWNWTLRTANGAVTTSGWGPSNAATIHPAQIAFLQSLSPRSVLPPAPVTACLSGPVQARTFSLHAETPKPFDDFVANTTRNPLGGPSTFCLTVVIPGTITPQTILMHIWDYESVTLLLYVLKVKVINATAAAGPNVAPPSWTSFANGVIALGAVGTGFAVVLAVRREAPVPSTPSVPHEPPRSPRAPKSAAGVPPPPPKVGR